MTGGFYERLSAISADQNDADDMAELVVAALGSFGRYYICWKTRSGEYKQESSGLPLPLQEWLFPSTGETRDFPTLQVVLGHDDDFFASDAHGKVEHKAAPPPERTASPQTIPNSDSPNPALDRASRRRSRTMSLIGPPASFRLSVSPIIEAVPSVQPPRPTSNPSTSSHSLSSSLSSSSIQPPPFVPGPLARVRTERDWKRRPRSIAFGDEEDYIPSPPHAPLLRRRSSRGGRSSPSPPIPLPKTSSSSSSSSLSLMATPYCVCGCHSANLALPPQPSSSSAGNPAYVTSAAQTLPPPPPPPPRPTYVSAAVQTDAPLPPSPQRAHRSRRGRSRSKRRRHRASVTPSYASASTSDYDEDEDEDDDDDDDDGSSAAATDITTPSTYGKVVAVVTARDAAAAAIGKANPVVMGQMQSYFRSSGYQLGDALRPVSVFGGGTGAGYWVGDGGEGTLGGLGVWREAMGRRGTV